jgi:O-methyltransferase
MGLPEPIRTVKPFSQLSYLNLFFLQELTRRLELAGTEGDFIECGVYQGGSAGVLADAANRSSVRRHVWLYDSFSGMPMASEFDDESAHAIVGKNLGSIPTTKKILQPLGVQPHLVTIVPGWYEETLASAPRPPVALLHVDCDFYESVRLVLETFYPSVTPGGFVVIDDYGAFPGCRRAVDEFLVRQSDAGPLQQIDRDAHFLQKAP